ncbi:DUF1770-domain-containing protein [Aureobasidium pullulans]|nr:DUF1770-domain-containing protein [Aureobasidium pullulans]
MSPSKPTPDTWRPWSNRHSPATTICHDLPRPAEHTNHINLHNKTCAMADEPIIQLAETIQTASINRHPSPAHDANPSTAASMKQPVRLDDDPDLDTLPDDIDDDEIPVSVLRPSPRSKQFPPLPDLRFEQSYLASIQHADTWQSVAWITFRDQLFMPLTQGLLWTLVVAGWRNWNTVHNTSHNFSGSSIGARLRRWWWKTNNWSIPRSSLRDQRLAGKVQEYYQAEFSAGAD